MSTLQDRTVSRAGGLSKSDPYYQIVTQEKLNFLEAYQRATDALEDKNSPANKSGSSDQEKERAVSDLLKPVRETAQKLWLRLDQAEKAHKGEPELVTELQRIKSNVLSREALLRADAFEKVGDFRGQQEELDRSLMYTLLKENVGQKNLLQLFNSKGAGFATGCAGADPGVYLCRRAVCRGACRSGAGSGGSGQQLPRRYGRFCVETG